MNTNTIATTTTATTTTAATTTATTTTAAATTAATTTGNSNRTTCDRVTSEAATRMADMPRRRANWCFGPPFPHSEAQATWWKRHEPTVDSWLAAMERADNPWWQSADHAAYCLVSYDFAYTWEGFSVKHFLFRSLSDGGTVGFFGSVRVFFEQLVEALERFVADGLVPMPDGEQWLREMRDSREEFLRCYRVADHAVVSTTGHASTSTACVRSYSTSSLAALMAGADDSQMDDAGMEVDSRDEELDWPEVFSGGRAAAKVCVVA